MATYKVRGAAHNVIYPYRTENGDTKQQWETYDTELEALQRKAFIDALQKTKNYTEIRKAAAEYKRQRAIERTQQELAQLRMLSPDIEVPGSREDNTFRTYKEFMEKFIPFHSRKKRVSPNTYDGYISTLKNHIYPYFGDWVMSSITAEDIDLFLDHLSRKPCSGSKAYNKKPGEVPRLSSSTIKKCFNVLTMGFETAKKWRYITEIPEVTAPSEKYKRRKAWEPEQIYDFLTMIEDDTLLHLAVHIGFVCSLRAGEVAGLDVRNINIDDQSMWITQILQRVSDDAIKTLPEEEIIRVFPKKLANSKTSLILKGPKTEESYRKQYLTAPLAKEIGERLKEIAMNKEVFGPEYHDYGLLICNADGTPLEPKWLGDAFKDTQRKLKITDLIEFQGLRKSGQMHKVRLSNNNYQLVAEAAGQSPEVLMSNYNEARESEKRALAGMVEKSFYPASTQGSVSDNPTSTEQKKIMEARDLLNKVQEDPDLSQQLLRLLLSSAISRI